MSGRRPQVQSIEFTQIEMQVIEGLRAGNECLNKMHQVGPPGPGPWEGPVESRGLGPHGARRSRLHPRPWPRGVCARWEVGKQPLLGEAAVQQDRLGRDL